MCASTCTCSCSTCLPHCLRSPPGLGCTSPPCAGAVACSQWTRSLSPRSGGWTAAGLREALKATQDHRLRVVLAKRRVVGYAVCGASAGRGFVQRLAVAPDWQGRGIGRKLLLDGLYWLQGRGLQEVAVNTQVGNGAALALYHQLGFKDDLAGLSVLTAGLAPSRAE